MNDRYGPPLLLSKYPTAHTSLADNAATALRPLFPVPTLGLETTDQTGSQGSNALMSAGAWAILTSVSVGLPGLPANALTAVSPALVARVSNATNPRAC